MKKQFYCENCHKMHIVILKPGANLIEYRCPRCGWFIKVKYIYTPKPKIIKPKHKPLNSLQKLRDEQQKLYDKLLKEFKTG